MGVHGLWDLLAPVGRRVSVDTLSGKRLAIDASIWLVQFMKAMRDDKGEMIHNAHLIGFFRRICKLLFLRTKPVFVFDGGTPVLKRRTVIARRRQRENAQAKVRKTAEKLLLNHLKALKLKQIENDIKNQRQKHVVDAKVSNNGAHKLEVVGSVGRSNVGISVGKSDEIPGAFATVEKEQNTSSSVGADESEDEEMILPSTNIEVDPDVLAALPPSMQADLVKQNERKKMEAEVTNYEIPNPQFSNNAKGKGILLDEIGMQNADPRNYDQSNVDELLAASIAAEEGGTLVNNMSSSGGIFMSEEEEDDNDDEELILPSMPGGVDPSILASLPPSMQLDLLVQMRERLIAENRQKYQKVKKDPTKFSELQIQAYLKTVAFRREIDEVQKTASGRGVGGIQTSRIASEANREFIFSSSFTGDKKQLMTTSITRNENEEQRTSNLPSSVPRINTPTSVSDPASQVVQDNSAQVFDDSIHTYCDESGLVRVSRLRAMGLRMTRDIQRNLDFMKEIEQQNENSNNDSSRGLDLDARNDVGPSSSNNQSVACSNEEPVELIAKDDGNVPSIVQDNNASIQICFVDGGQDKCFDGDDQFFASLVVGNPVIVSCDRSPQKQSCASDSDSDWEEGTIAGNCDKSSPSLNKEMKFHSEVRNVSDESEVEWEEGVSTSAKGSSPHASERGKAASKGHLEEEVELQEAIRRSLEDSRTHMFKGAEPHLETLNGSISNSKLFQGGRSEGSGEKAFNSTVSLQDETIESNCGEDISHRKEVNLENVDGREKLDFKDGNDCMLNINFPTMQSKLAIVPNCDKMGMIMTNNQYVSLREQSSMDANEGLAKEVHVVSGRQMDASSFGNLNKVPAVSGEASHTFNENDVPSYPDMSLGTDTISCTPSKDENNPANRSDSLYHSANMTRKDFIKADMQKTVASKSQVTYCNSSEGNVDKDATSIQQNLLEEWTETSLEEEMHILNQERLNLGTEQRKLERNAESVNSELFTECQELLQMFGLPYIIAPMEAEAQCAYMEQTKLVDGVVTDDSDVFLFGACSVYKNIFDDRKYVETYFMEDIEKELGLNREKLIRMAMLLGSDYTEGISGIGIVNAIEVVNAFPEEDGLLKFREWIESPDPTILGRFDTRTGSSSRKRSPKVDDEVNCSTCSDAPSDQEIAGAQKHTHAATDTQEIKQIFMDKHRNVSKNWHIPPSFPSEAVIAAYSSPQVDKSTEPFTWGKPDHLVLRKLCWEKFGWASQKTDELLVPVLKEYNKCETQLRLEAFYTFNERFAKIRSKRIKKAVKGITGNRSSELTAQDTYNRRKNKRLSHNEFAEKSGTSKGTGKKVKVETSRKRKGIEDSEKNYKDATSCRSDIQEAGTQAEGQRFRSQSSRGNREGRSGGEGSGRGRGFQRKGVGHKLCQTTSSDGSQTDEVHVEKAKGPLSVRRSTRLRKPVVYVFNGLESDDADNSSELKYKSCSDEEADKQESQDLFQAGATCHISDLCSADISFEKGLLRDHSEPGATSHDAEGEIDRAGAEDCCEPSLERESSFDYRKSGGGFCVDDEDEGNDDHRAHGPSIAEAEGSAVHSHIPNTMDEDDGGKLHEMESNFSILNPTSDRSLSFTGASSAENGDDDRKSFRESLSAMPNLRRKRKKT